MAGLGASTAAATSASASSQTLKNPAGSTSASQSRCGNPQTRPSDPNYLTQVGGTVFFTAADGIHGRELWKSDGTRAGTVLVKNITPGGSSGYYEYGPYDLTNVGGTLFFTDDDGIHGRELWKSDGTKAGTVMVKNITPGGSGNYSGYGPSDLTNVGGTLFFTDDDGIHGRELWKSDGTKAGTVMVKNITPGAGRGYRNGPSDLTNVGGTLFFSDDDGAHGRELWKSDGTEAGTVLVKNIHPSNYSSDPSFLTDVRGTLFFTATDGVHGEELWKSDGTRAGTVLVKNINPGVGGGGYYYNYGPSDLTNVSGALFFADDDGTHGEELWKSDGTRAGTVLVKDINPGIGGGGYYYGYGPSYLTNVRGTLFFADDDGTHGQELWKSDGSRAGTVMVKNINPGAYSGDPSYLTAMGPMLFFTAKDGTHGPELWKSDGTMAGTSMVKDIHPCAAHPGPSGLTDVKGTLFFAASDGVHGDELWKSDGSNAGTVLVKDINQKSADATSPRRAKARRAGVHSG